jgi:hypothetical protein
LKTNKIEVGRSNMHAGSGFRPETNCNAGTISGKNIFFGLRPRGKILFSDEGRGISFAGQNLSSI